MDRGKKMEDDLVNSAQNDVQNRMGEKIKKQNLNRETSLQSSNRNWIDYPIQERCLRLTVDTENGKVRTEYLLAHKLRTTRNPRGIWEEKTWLNVLTVRGVSG